MIVKHTCARCSCEASITRYGKNRIMITSDRKHLPDGCKWMKSEPEEENYK